MQKKKLSLYDLIMLGVLEPPGEPVAPPKGSRSELMQTAEGCEKLSKMEDDRPEVQLLFGNLKKESDKLFELLKSCDGEDLLYRFYHGSFKCYGLQQHTKKIVENLQKLLPERDLNESFMAIVHEGTGKDFNRGANSTLREDRRFMAEAFFHARYFLEMAVKYSKELKLPPACFLPSGWAAFLYLYNLR
ncbi:MAG: hypothetical protein Q7W05_15185 [Deltaproteobacteria bacterium]|nr:hypothetical protein [Deltaproteobacteria bacterium]